MRLVIHDYCGHAFPVQLSRALAARSHDVLHLHFSDFQTPKGPLALRHDDPPTLRIEGVSLGTHAKYSLVKRSLQDLAYGRAVRDRVAAFRPDHILSAQMPLDGQRVLLRWARRNGVAFHFWLQDILSRAIAGALRTRLGPAAAPIAWYYRRLERSLLRSSDSIICIADDFARSVASWDVDASRIHVVENWASHEDLRPLEGPASWVAEQGLDGHRLVVYAGTLGLKHNPALLLAVAQDLAADPAMTDAVLVVISEGLGADWLRARQRELGLKNLRILPFQPYDRLAEVLSSADVLVAILEHEAGTFSVPSKVLSYFCAGRPLVLAAPAENLASRIVARERAGLLADPTSPAVFAAAVRRLLSDSEASAALASSARTYAERSFAIGPIASSFERIMGSARTG